MIWQVGLSSSAIRDLDKLPPRVAPAVIEFIYGPLAGDPRRISKPLRNDFEDEWSARRGVYRVLYRLLEDQEQIMVTRMGTDRTSTSLADRRRGDYSRLPP
ncbi:MAG: type II toxin-antitoxin system RelE family toxin [Nocardioidaceae bacterium]